MARDFLGRFVAFARHANHIAGLRPGQRVGNRLTPIGNSLVLPGEIFSRDARFHVVESDDYLAMNVTSDDGETDVSFVARTSKEWQPTTSFESFEEVSTFFKKGDCGFSCSLSGEALEGLQLKTLKWEMTPLEVDSQHASFYSDPLRFPAGSIEFDCGLLMRGIEHEWHQLTDIPELASRAG